MNKISEEITKKIKNLPEPYLKEVIDFIDFMDQKNKKNADTEYFKGIPGITESIKEGRKMTNSALSIYLVNHGNHGSDNLYF